MGHIELVGQLYTLLCTPHGHGDQNSETGPVDVTRGQRRQVRHAPAIGHMDQSRGHADDQAEHRAGGDCP